MKTWRFSIALVIALLTLSVGRASAFTLVPPSIVGGIPGVGAELACPALAAISAGSNGLWAVTDPQCLKGALNSGWTTTAVPQVLTPASSVTWDLSKGCQASIAFPTAGQNVTLTATNIPFCTGKDVVLYTAQPASGTTSNTATFSTGFTANSAIPAVKTGTSATDVITFKDNNTLVEYPVVGANFASAGGGSSSFASQSLTGSGNGVLTLTNDGQITAPLGTGTKPSVGTCGSGSASASSTDLAGDVTATGATACTVIFNASFTNKPVCTATDETTAAGLKVTYSTGVSITVTGLTSGDEFTYICIGK
jgi:hypothetical protein